MSIMTNAEDQLIRMYGTSFIKCTKCSTCINILFITTLELCLKIQAGLLNIDTGVNSSFLSSKCNPHKMFLVMTILLNWFLF